MFLIGIQSSSLVTVKNTSAIAEWVSVRVEFKG